VGSLYDVLGARVDASDDDLRRAYHRRAGALHPDRHSGAPEPELRDAERAMQQLNAAWEVLGDPDQRRRYDAQQAARRERATGRRTTGPGSPHPAATPAAYASVVDWYANWGDRPDEEWERGDDEDHPFRHSVAVPVWIHRLTVLLIGAVIVALLVGSALASRTTPLEDVPGSRPLPAADPHAGFDDGSSP
jgi:curved DNA-binding protein CbpA